MALKINQDIIRQVMFRGLQKWHTVNGRCKMEFKKEKIERIKTF